MKRPILLAMALVALAAGAFFVGCKADGAVDPVAVGQQLELAAGTAADLAVVYEAEKPDTAADLLVLSDWLEIAGRALQLQEGAEARSALDSALALADKLLRESDDPDVQAGLILVKSVVRQAQIGL